MTPEVKPTTPAVEPVVEKKAFDPTSIDPTIAAYFAEKEKPLAAKRDELLGQVAEFKKLIEEAGGVETIKTWKDQASKAAADVEAARVSALSKEDLLKEREAHYARLIGERDEKISKFEQRVIDKEVNAAITEAIAAAEGNPKLLGHIVRQSVKASIDANGEVVLSVTAPDGKPSDIKALVASLRNDDDYAAAFKAPHVSGTGTRKSADVVSTDNPFDPKAANFTKQMEMIKSDPAKAKKLAAIHGMELKV